MDIGNQDTPVQEFYRGSTILITGGTGFLGKVLIEKIMRVCPNFNKMYLIMRPKKGKDKKQRIQELFEHPLYSQVDPSVIEKVSALSGDCLKPLLGLSNEDQKLLQDDVSIIFHSAATLRFDERLKLAVAINIIATRDLIELAKGMKNLKAFVHVSTAYSNIHLTKIEEKFYEPIIESQKLIELTENLDESQAEQLTPKLLKEYPNTYTYTKTIAEGLFQKYSDDIPVAVVRPSIVLAANEEPVPGWIDSINGPTLVVVLSRFGSMRIMQCDPELIANIIPVDMVANAMITAAWDLRNSKNQDGTTPNQKIYNVESSARNPITWERFFSLTYKFLRDDYFNPSYSSTLLHKNKLNVQIISFICHFMPALILDLNAVLFCKKPSSLNAVQRINKVISSLSYFSTRQWDFNDQNTLAMWEKLDHRDKLLFPFDVAEINWDEYLAKYAYGIRMFLVKGDQLSKFTGTSTDRRKNFPVSRV